MGLWGQEEIPKILCRNDVTEYADYKLTCDNADNGARIQGFVDIICNADDGENLDKTLIKLLKNDRTSAEFQKRKWRVYLLKETLNDMPDDSLQGLLRLMEFWISMNCDCPTEFPKSDKENRRYFTKKTYDKILAQNNAWLNKEISEIVMREKKCGSTSLCEKLGTITN